MFLGIGVCEIFVVVLMICSIVFIMFYEVRRYSFSVLLVLFSGIILGLNFDIYGLIRDLVLVFFSGGVL